MMPSYNDFPNLKESLLKWIEYKERQTEDQWILCVLDGCFNSFPLINNSYTSTDGSLEFLQKLYIDKKIDILETISSSQIEHEVKTIGLKKLLEKDIDYFVTFATDEVLTFEQIDFLVKYIKKRSFIGYFKCKFKNFVFDRQHFILDFIAQRIYKVNYNVFRLDRFFWDDDLIYKGDGKEVSFEAFPSVTIPSLLIDHYTWCDNERSRLKVEYQKSHFNHGAGCSFKWNYVENRLEWNEEYFKRTGQIIPEVYVNT